MTWFAWRQFRIPAIVAACALAASAVLLAATKHIVTNIWFASGAATCQTSCLRVNDMFSRELAASPTGAIYQAALVAVYVLPALIGLFWGAPLVARELEAGTHRLAWSQSITRTRWLATKLGFAAIFAAATAGLLSWIVTVWSQHIDETTYHRISPLLFGARGIVPIGYALFALALGVTAGMIIRRTVPAMAVTLGVYVAVVASMPLLIRSHLVTPDHTISPLNLHSIDLSIGAPDLTVRIVSVVVPNGSWVLTNNTITGSGAIFTGPADPTYCGSGQGVDTCLNWIGTLGLRQDLTFQPASHFWPLQWVETGIFVAAAAALVAFCFWWTKRRLS